jgi:hypothetical protein
MKTFLRMILVGYFYCGIALGFIVWLSYMWGLQAAVSADVPMAERARATWDIQPMVVLHTGTRIIAWGPSLAIWAAMPNDHSFGRWLAPGFYIRRLSPAA